MNCVLLFAALVLAMSAVIMAQPDPMVKVTKLAIVQVNSTDAAAPAENTKSNASGRLGAGMVLEEAPSFVRKGPGSMPVAVVSTPSVATAEEDDLPTIRNVTKLDIGSKNNNTETPVAKPAVKDNGKPPASTKDSKTVRFTNSESGASMAVQMALSLYTVLLVHLIF